MPFRHPLTFTELHAIRLRHTRPDGSIDPDVLALLHEARQKRSFVLRFYQVSPDLRRPTGLMGDIYDDLLAWACSEPCVVERDQDVMEMMEAPNKLRKGMAPR